MSNLNLKGLWIPIEVLTDKNLSDKEKVIFSLIVFLSQEKQYCFCTNKIRVITSRSNAMSMETRYKISYNCNIFCG